MIDSGSQVTTVSASFVESHPTLSRITPEPSPVSINGAGGHTLPHIGVIPIEIKCQGRVYINVPALIVPSNSYGPGVDALVGTNLIRVFQRDERRTRGDTYLSHLKKQNDAWYTACAAMDAALPGDRIGKIGVLTYQGKAPKVINPGEETDVFCRPPRQVARCTALIEPLGRTHHGTRMVVGRILVDVNAGGHVPVRLLNTSDKPLTIYPGTKLARMYIACAYENSSHPGDNAPVHMAHVSAGTPPSPHPSPTIPDIDLSTASFNSQAEKTNLASLLHEYADVFSQHDFDYGCASGVEHEIPLIDDDPFRLPYRRIPPAQFQEVRRHIQEMEKAGVIKKSSSPYASPIVVVQKKDGSIRLCVDYRRLNSKTRRDAFPIPRIDEALDALGKAKYFSTLDLTSGYWQVKVAEKDQPKTAFTTPMGLYECARMPFGLQNAPATFQRLMTACLGEHNFESLLIYLDDVIVFSSTYKEHLQRLELVFQSLRRFGLKLKPRKCHLLQEKVNYLGHVISAKGIETDPEKTSAVSEWPRPKNSREVRRFLGFTGYYRRFVQGYAKIARPLFQLTEGGSRKRKPRNPPPLFEWSDECEQAFNTLKTTLTNPPILGFPDFEQPFQLEVDASGTGLGAVLSQTQGGTKRIIAYASKSLTPSEKKYPAHKLEFLALKWAVVDKFREYLLGRRFHVLTDNNPLLYVTSSAKLDATGQRWVSALADFDFSVEYRSGRTNAAADALSRHPSNEPGHETQEERHLQTEVVVSAVFHGIQTAQAANSATSPQLMANLHTDVAGTPSIDQISPDALSRKQRSDPDIGPVIPIVERGAKPTRQEAQGCSPEAQLLLRQFDRLTMKDGVLHRSVQDPNGTKFLQLVLPRCFHKTVLGHLHDDVGHPGWERTLSTVRQRFFWPRMSKDIQNWCITCRRCCLRKTPTTGNRAPLSSIHTSEPLELVCIDFLKLEKSRGGYENVLVVTDHFTRYSQAYPTKDQLASTVAKTLWQNFFVHYGFPRRLHADQGRNFESRLISELCKVAGIQKSRTTAYHPQGNGTTERFNRTLIDMIGTLDPSEKANWKDHLGQLTHAYNATKHESTGFAPFQLMFGRHPNLPVDVMFGLHTSDESKEYDEYVESFREGLQAAYDMAAGKSKSAKDRQKTQFDKRAKVQPLAHGDRVLVMDKTTGGRKLADKWEANPYVILSKHADLPVYTIKRVNSDRVRTVHRNLLTPCMFLPLDDLPQTSTGAVPPPTPTSPDTQTDQPEENGDEDEMSDRPDEGGDDGFFLRQNEDVRVPKRNGSHHEAAPRDPMPQQSADPHIEDTEANAPSPAPSEEMPQRAPTPQEPPPPPTEIPETPPPANDTGAS